jgi:hypothetical protein
MKRAKQATIEAEIEKKSCFKTPARKYAIPFYVIPEYYTLALAPAQTLVVSQHTTRCSSDGTFFFHVSTLYPTSEQKSLACP